MTILTGARITADDIAALEARLPMRARMTAGVNKTNNTFADLTGLSWTVAASSLYRFDGRIIATGANTTHDLKLQWVLPASATVEWSAYGGTTAAVTSAVNSLDMGSTSAGHARGSFAGTLVIPIAGIITIAGTAGTAKLQGAQNTTDAGTLTFVAGSHCELQLWV